MKSYKEKKPKKFKGMKIEVDIENKVKRPVEKKPKKSIEISYSEAKRSKKKK